MLALQDPAIIADEVTQSGSHGSLSMICTDDVVSLLRLPRYGFLAWSYRLEVRARFTPAPSSEASVGELR